MNLIDLYEILDKTSEKIGNSASVGFELMRREGRMPSLVFRVDWYKENFRFCEEFTITRLLAQPEDIIKIVIYQAQKAFANRVDA